MAVLQKVKFNAQQRLDIPDLQAIQGLVCADFAQFFDKIISNEPYIITGFEVPNPRSIINALTSNGLPITIANSVLFNSFSFNVSTQGGAFYVATPTELQQVATLVAGTTNYIEIELSISSTTPDVRKFWDPDKNIEFSQVVDTVEYIDAIITSNTVGFTADRVPICKVITSSATPGPSVISSITDCRPLYFRLGTGGASPSPLYQFPWVDDPVTYARVDQPIIVTSSSPATDNPFRGSDKNIRNEKEWKDAVMTRFCELSGKPNWFTYSGGGATANLANLWWDTMMSEMTGTGAWEHDATTSGKLTWTSDIYVYSTLGRYYYKILAGTKTLTDNQVLYLIHNRDVAFPGGITAVFDSTKNYVNSSTGLAGVFTGLIIGDWVRAISDGVEAYSQIVNFYDGLNATGALTTAANALSILIANAYDKGTSITTSAVYAKLSYNPASDLVVANRLSVPNNPNVSWIAIREDNGGGKPLLYLRNGSELKKGESIEISDETSEELLAYIGAADESVSIPARIDYGVLLGSLAVQQDYSCVTGENLTVRQSKLTSMIADKAQDKTVSIREGGLFTWDLATQTLSWTDPILISIPSSTFNETIAAGSVVINVGECVYFTIDRNAVALDIRMITVDTEANVPLDEVTFVLAKRGLDDKIYLMDGTVCVDNGRVGLGGYSNPGLYDATLWGAKDDNGATDNSIPLGNIIDNIKASNNYQAVIYFPPGTGPANYYYFNTTLTKDLTNYNILITGSPLGKGEMGGLKTAFHFASPAGNGWNFTNGSVSLSSILFEGGDNPPNNLVGIKLNSCNCGFIHNCHWFFDYIIGMQLNSCTDYKFDLNHIQGKVNCTSYNLDLQQCSRININNSYVSGASPGGNIGINIGFNNYVIDINNVYAADMPNGVINMRDTSHSITVKNAYMFTYADTCRGIIIDQTTDVELDNIVGSKMTTYDIELNNRPINVSISNYRSDKPGYTGINNLTGVTFIGNSNEQPSKLPYVQGITNRGADIISGVEGVKAIGKLVFTGVSIAPETLTVNAVVHTYVAGITSNPNEIRVGTTTALSASRTALYFNRNSTQRDKIWATSNGIDTVYFYAKDPGVAANAYTFTETLTNATIPGTTGFMNNQQVGVDPIDNFVVDSSGNATISGDSIINGGLDLHDRPIAGGSTTSLPSDLWVGYTAITGGGDTFTLQTVDCIRGKIIILKDESGTASVANPLKLDTQGGENIDGVPILSIIAPYGVLRVKATGSTWLTW